MNELQFNALMAEQIAGTISPENLVLLQAEIATRASNANNNQHSSGNGNNPPKTEITVAPRRFDVVGQLTDISEMITRKKNGVDKHFRMVNVHDGDKLHVFPMNELFYQANKRLLIIDNEVSFSFEQRVGGKTQYIDRTTGEIKTHSESGDSVVNVRRVSATMTLSQATALAEKKIVNNGDKPEHMQTLLANLYMQNASLVAKYSNKAQD